MAHFNPFPGLRPFKAEEDFLYFGREGQRDDLLRQLGRTRFVAVVGTSGSGKSSLVRAGLLPALEGGFMTRAGSGWRIATLQPGSDPIGKLADALNKPEVFGNDWGEDEADAAFQASFTEITLRRSDLGLVEVARQARLPDGENLLVVVDQFEELFRYKIRHQSVQASDDAAAFVKLLLAAANAESVPIYIVLTMRSDFLGECAQFRNLPEAINDGQYLIPRMTRDQRRRAIEGPVAVGGAAITPRLVQRLLNDVGDNPDQLPILQHALMRTWDIWQADGAGDEPIDLPHYEATGGMALALSHHADEIYAGLPDDRSREIAERLFKRLTDKGRGIRRPTRLDEIAAVAETSNEAVITVIEAFRRPGCSFLMPPVDVPLKAGSVIDISHESLMRVWVRLKDWATGEAESARIYRRLAETAILHQAGRAGLWDDPDLQLALDWRNTQQPNAAWAVRYHFEYETALNFLEKSRAARDAEQAEAEVRRRRALEQAQALAEAENRRAEAEKLRAEEQTVAAERFRKLANRFRGLAIGLAIVFLLAVIAAVFAWFQQQEAQRQARIATARQLAAQAQAVFPTHPQRSLLLALEALKMVDESELRLSSGEQALRDDLLTAGGHPLRVHEGTALAAVFGTEGQWLVTTGPDNSALLWDMQDLTVRPVTLSGHQAPILDAAFSADGRWLVTAGLDKTARLWDLQDPAAPDPLPPLVGHKSTIWAVALSPDGRWLVTAGDDEEARLWDLTKPAAAPAVLSGHQYQIRTVAISPDNHTLVTADKDKTARLWDISNPAKPKLLQLLSGHRATIRAVAFSPDGRWLVTAGNDEEARLLDMTSPDTDPVILSGHDGAVQAVAFSPDGQTLVTAGDDSTARIWNISNSPISDPIVLSGHEDSVLAAAFSPDGRWLVTAGSDNSARLWDLRNPTASTPTLTGHSHEIIAAAFSPDGRWLVTADDDETVRLWDLTDPAAPDPLPPLVGHEGTIWAVAFSPDGRWLVTAGDDKTARLWDLTKPAAAPIILYGHESSIRTLAISPDSRWLVTAGDDIVARLWDLSEPAAPPAPLSGHENTISAVAFSPDGQLLVTAGSDDTARLWDVSEPAAPPVTLSGHESSIKSVVFSPDGQTLITVSDDNTARLWNVSNATLANVINLSEHKDQILAVAISPNGRWLAIAGDDNSAHLWELSAPSAPPVTLPGHESSTIRTMTFSRDGRWLVTAALDDTARLWDMHDLDAPPVVLSGHDGIIRAAAFSPDGHWLVTAGRDNIARLRRLPLEDLIEEACHIAGRNLSADEWDWYFPGQLYRRTCPGLPSHPTVAE